MSTEEEAKKLEKVSQRSPGFGQRGLLNITGTQTTKDVESITQTQSKFCTKQSVFYPTICLIILPYLFNLSFSCHLFGQGSKEKHLDLNVISSHGKIKVW